MATNRISFNATLTMPQRKAMLEYAKSCADKDTSFLGNLRAMLLYRDLAYQRQLSTTAEHIKAVRQNMAGNGRAIQDMTVPIAMPQVESATAYQAGVFLTQYPIFGVVSDKEHIDQAKMFETALADQSIKYGWARELTKVLRNGFKYNFAPTVVEWKKTAIKKIVTRTDVDPDLAGKAGIESYSYGGNCVIACDPYNTFMDTLVPPANIHECGEFFGHNLLVNRVQLMTLIRGLDASKTTNLREAYESSFTGVSADSTRGSVYYRPAINPYVNLHSGARSGATDWMGYMGLKHDGNSIKYKDAYVLTPFYCRARPADFGASGNHLVTYKALIVNWTHVIYVEEMNVGYDGLPCLIAQPNEDGLGYQTQSLLDNAMPYQDMSSALWNINLQAKRRLVFDRLVYNPRMIDKKDIDIASAVSRIPLRNANMAKDGDNPIARAIYQIPYRDVDSSGLQMSQMIEQMADTATGQNKVDRGQFQKGNKTAAEFQTVMGNSNSRQQLTSITLEHQFFTPMKEIIRSNTLQYQPAGKLFSRETESMVEFDPVKLREAVLEFKLTDGMLPADKMLSPELLQVFMQTAQAVPAMATEFDVLGMFLYWVKLQGATWVNDFKRDPAGQQQFLSTLQQTTAATTPPTQPAAAVA
jgi:hypothetical protein